MDGIIAQVDQLTEDRIARNAEIKQLKEALQEAAQHLETARAAADANRRRSNEATGAIYGLLQFLDRLPEEVPGLRESPQYKAASHVIGWDIDWEAMSNG